MRTSLAERIENESVPEREERLEVARESARERRATNISFQEEHVESRKQYLHQGGWEDTENHLHEQEWVVSIRAKNSCNIANVVCGKKPGQPAEFK